MFRRSLSQTKNIPTIEMGDLAVREFDENTMIKTIRGFLNSHLKLNETERKIELQSNIPPDNDFWPLDDIRRSFEKLLHEKDKNQTFSRYLRSDNAPSEGTRKNGIRQNSED